MPPPDPEPTPTPTPCPDCSTTAVLSGQKFYDTNTNGAFDAGEAPVAGVQIIVVITTAGGTPATYVTYVTTDALGIWSLTVPAGAQYIISEYLPDTDPETEPGGYWEQTAPLPDEEGFRGYSGTVSGDQGSFNFGNICFHEGNPFPSGTPCSVRNPPPQPTSPGDDQ